MMLRDLVEQLKNAKSLTERARILAEIKAYVMQTGPRGGKFYYAKSGRKIYRALSAKSKKKPVRIKDPTKSKRKAPSRRLVGPPTVASVDTSVEDARNQLRTQFDAGGKSIAKSLDAITAKAVTASESVAQGMKDIIAVVQRNSAKYAEEIKASQKQYKDAGERAKNSQVRGDPHEEKYWRKTRSAWGKMIKTELAAQARSDAAAADMVAGLQTFLKADPADRVIAFYGTDSPAKQFNDSFHRIPEEMFSDKNEYRSMLDIRHSKMAQPVNSVLASITELSYSDVSRAYKDQSADEVVSGATDSLAGARAALDAVTYPDQRVGWNKRVEEFKSEHDKAVQNLKHASR